MILVSFFAEDYVLSDEIKICYIFEYQSNENWAFRFFGTPGIHKIIINDAGTSHGDRQPVEQGGHDCVGCPVISACTLFRPCDYVTLSFRKEPLFEIW